ncbi:AI-2E family transporter [Clostridium ganghwense]|uniref:AI-2E family transporter n=1 Tax=Clostridium ganghwense TaxID=312089 RepID=A0ABT4CTA6_9CLOT|nr:AI-2E family transporter [Clostridium ganghwense]MCY6372315.1 AI-2E family transporter [Clostridium ganghwense]
MKINEIFKNKLIKSAVYICIITFIIFIILKISILKEIVFLLLISFVVAYSLKPLQKILLERGMKLKHSAILLILGLFVTVIMIFTLLIPSIFRESLNIGNTIDEIGKYFGEFYHRFKPLGDNKIIYTLINNINNKINKGFIDLFNRVLELGAEFGENALSYIVIPIITYYFLCDGEYLFNKILLFCPLNSRRIIRKINRDVDKILGRYIVSQFMLCIMISIITFIALILTGVKLPIILSILNGIFNIIPYFGPILGAVPAVIMAFLTSPKTALYTAGCLYVIQLIEGNIISPKVTGESVSIHPIGVIIILLLGEKIGGLLGMVLAVPISVIIKVIYEDLNYYLF